MRKYSYPHRMRKAVEITVIMILILAMNASTSYAAPQGYIDIKLTKKNFKQFFEPAKVPVYYSSNKCYGFEYVLKSKLLKKGYYLYDDLLLNDSNDNYFVFTFSARFSNSRPKNKLKLNSKNRERINYRRRKTINRYDFFSLESQSCDYKGYKSAKIHNFKIHKIRSVLTFIEPDNVIGVERVSDGIMIKLKYPYNSDTMSVGHYDIKTNEYIVDYYYYKPVTYGKDNSIILR